MRVANLSGLPRSRQRCGTRGKAVESKVRGLCSPLLIVLLQVRFYSLSLFSIDVALLDATLGRR
jgi:hypothetical protein